MTVQDDNLQHLRCMHSGSVLRAADAELLARLNAAIQSGSIKDGRGNRVQEPFSAGLVNDDVSVFYPVVNGVLQMMDDECLQLARLADNEGGTR